MSIRLLFLVVANVFVAGLGVVGFLAIDLFDQASERYTSASAKSNERILMSDRISANLPELRTLELEYITAQDSETARALLGRIVDRREDLRAVMDHYENGGDSRSDPECASCHDAFSRYIHSHEQMLSLAATGRSADAHALYSISAEQYAGLLLEAEKFRQVRLLEARADIRDGEAAGDAARRTLIGAFVLAAVVAFVLGHAFSAHVSRRLALLVEGTRRVMRGDLERTIPVHGHDEFAELGRSFNVMTDSLKATREDNAKLQDAAIRLREERIALLSEGLKRVTEAQENERKRVSRELHDGVGQALTALQLGLGRLAKTTRSPRARSIASSLHDLAVETMKDVRELALDLRPSLLDQVGLAGTLQSYTRTLSERTGIPIAFGATGVDRNLSPELEITIFRVVQEALANTAKYARATSASVQLALTGGTLELVVADDGVGFDVEVARANYLQHLGLAGMEERCRFSGGTFAVVSAPGEGTRIACRWSAPAGPPGVEGKAPASVAPAMAGGGGV